MGRWSSSSKTEADTIKRIQIWWLKKYGYLNGWKSGSIIWKSGFDGSESSVGLDGSMEGRYIRIYYTQTNRDTSEIKKFDYKVYLTTTPCKYGGARYWFTCPLIRKGVHCGKRVGVLYKDGDYFGCRHCYDLTYSSKNENRKYGSYYLFRILDVETKIEKIRETMKRSFYAGKPTRKMRRIMRLHEGTGPYVATLMRNEKNGIL